MTELVASLEKSISGQEPGWKNILTRGVIDLLGRDKQDVKKLSQHYEKGYQALRQELESAVSDKKRDAFTGVVKITDSTPEIDRHRRVELEKQLLSVKAITLSIMDQLGFNDEVQSILQRPEQLKTQFTLEANGPTARSSFSSDGNQYEVDFTFWEKKASETNRELGLVSVTGANDNTVTEMTLDQNTFSTDWLIIGQGSKYPKPNNGSMGKYVQLSKIGNIFVQNSHDWLDRQGDNTYNGDGVLLTKEGKRLFSEGKWPKGETPSLMGKALATIKPEGVADFIKDMQSTSIDWGKQNWFTEGVAPKLPEAVKNLVTAKEIV